LGDPYAPEMPLRRTLGTLSLVFILYFSTSGGPHTTETLVHEVFFRLLNDEPLRRGFRGGSFAAWLRVIARNQAIDYALEDAAAQTEEAIAGQEDFLKSYGRRMPKAMWDEHEALARRIDGNVTAATAPIAD